MNVEAKHLLGDAIAKYGEDLIYDDRLCKAYLSDILVDYPEEKQLLLDVSILHIHRKLSAYLKGEISLEKLQLYIAGCEDAFLDERQSLHWGIDAWAYGLGVEENIRKQLLQSHSQARSTSKQSTEGVWPLILVVTGLLGGGLGLAALDKPVIQPIDNVSDEIFLGSQQISKFEIDRDRFIARSTVTDDIELSPNAVELKEAEKVSEEQNTGRPLKFERENIEPRKNIGSSDHPSKPKSESREPSTKVDSSSHAIREDKKVRLDKIVPSKKQRADESLKQVKPKKKVITEKKQRSSPENKARSPIAKVHGKEKRISKTPRKESQVVKRKSVAKPNIRARKNVQPLVSRKSTHAARKVPVQKNKSNVVRKASRSTAKGNNQSRVVNERKQQTEKKRQLGYLVQRASQDIELYAKTSISIRKKHLDLRVVQNLARQTKDQVYQQKVANVQSRISGFREKMQSLSVSYTSHLKKLCKLNPVLARNELKRFTVSKHVKRAVNSHLINCHINKNKSANQMNLELSRIFNIKN